MPHQQTPADPGREAQRPPGQVPGTAVSTFINRAVGALAPAAGPIAAACSVFLAPACDVVLCGCPRRKNGGATPR